jgi:bifunctional DNA-binding transcriptional regulator/antitoxin component of YhaV-PrlF toxin-antitoxin module
LEVKEIDSQGRVVIPKSWRSRVLRGRKVVMRLKRDSIEISSLDQDDLTRFFDAGSVDVEGSMDDWHSYRRELRRRKG